MKVCGMAVALSLAAVTALSAVGAAAAPAATVSFPPELGILDVTRPEYGAVPDDGLDDTKAIQLALEQYANGGAIIYMPPGVYHISDTLRWPVGTSGSVEAKRTTLQGAGKGVTTLMLMDRCAGFTDPQTPKAMIWTGNKPAQRFSNAVRDLTVDIGEGNRGAIGVQFNASNQGTLRDVIIRSRETGAGAIGLDLAYTDEVGPLLVKDVLVEGFEVGVACGHTVNSQTFENLTVRGQGRVGLTNQGQCVTIRAMRSENSVPAVMSLGHMSFLTLIEAKLGGGAAGNAAVTNDGGAMFVRDLEVQGYGIAIRDGAGAGGVSDAKTVDEYTSHPVLSVFETRARSLGLEIAETPVVERDPVEAWRGVQEFGATANDNRDDAAAIQQAIDSGATTVYFPRGKYMVSTPIVVRGKVRRFIGGQAVVTPAPKMVGPVFRVEDGEAPVVLFERIGGGYEQNLWLEHAAGRTVVMSSMANTNAHVTNGGVLFVEDVCSNPFTDWVVGKGGRMWARQLNIENEGTHLTNAGGTVWVLGYKTERPGTLAKTIEGGSTEIIGGFAYATTREKVEPMFVLAGEGSRMSVSLGESCNNGKPFWGLWEQESGGVTRTLWRGDAPRRQGGSVLPLVVGGPPAGAGEPVTVPVPARDRPAEAPTEIPPKLPAGR